MEKNVINLKFDKIITNLSGNRLGVIVYNEQVKDKFINNKENEVIFPEQIEDIASSFIQGLYSEISEKYGKIEAQNLMILKAKNKEAEEKIDECIKTYGV